MENSEEVGLSIKQKKLGQGLRRERTLSLSDNMPLHRLGLSRLSINIDKRGLELVLESP